MKVYNRPMAEGEQRTNGRSLEDRIHTSLDVKGGRGQNWEWLQVFWLAGGLDDCVNSLRLGGEGMEEDTWVKFATCWVWGTCDTSWSCPRDHEVQRLEVSVASVVSRLEVDSSMLNHGAEAMTLLKVFWEEWGRENRGCNSGDAQRLRGWGVVQGEEDSKRVMMSANVASVKGGDHFKKEGTVSRLELADKPCKSWCCQIKYRVPYMIIHASK